MRRCKKPLVFEHFRLPCNRKAQIQTQVFIYLLSMVIVGLVLIYGYNAVTGFREKEEQVSLIAFENQLGNTIKKMSSDYGSLKKETLQLPSGYQMLCFVDNSLLGDSDFDCRDLSLHFDQDMKDAAVIVNDAVIDGTANIFIVPPGTDNYKIGNIKLSDNEFTGYGPLDADGCLCIEKVGLQTIFRIEGLGDGVEITRWS